MRDLAKGERRTGRRGRARSRYADYMASPQWRQRRIRWVEEYRDRFGTHPSCTICGGPWALKRDDLHHHDYAQLGDEPFDEGLRSLHRPHHQLRGAVEETVGGLQPAGQELVGGERDDMVVAERPGTAEEPDVTPMQQVEGSVSENALHVRLQVLQAHRLDARLEW